MNSTQQQISSELGVHAEIDASEEIDRRVSFLVEYARSVPGCRGYVLGISGGQDSTLAGRIAQLAVERLRKNDETAAFTAVRLPYGEQHDEADARLALDFIRPDHEITVQIKPSVDALAESIAAGSGEPVSDFNKGNIKARARMMAQYAIAGDRGLLVIGTDHAAEAITGFFTKFGDGAADVMPLAGLTKSQGKTLLRALDAPSRLWQKPPTADLLDENPGETDESSLGVSYEEIDAFLTGDDVSRAVRENLVKRYRFTEHKRRLPVSALDDWWQ